MQSYVIANGIELKIHLNCVCSSNSRLNNDQRKIIDFVSHRRHHSTPLLVVYGPFGTGKTETLAQAAIMLASQNRDTRILICTKSNL